MSILTADILTPIWLLAILFLMLMITILGFVFFYTDMKRYAPEAIKFKAARKNHLPLLMIHDASGKCEIVLGKKKKKGDVIYDTQEYGIFIDQNLQGMPPEDRTTDGVRIYHYATSFPFPISGKNARGLQTVLEHVRSKYPQFNLVSDLEIIELVGTDADELIHDCENLIKGYNLKLKDFPDVIVDTREIDDEIEKEKMIIFGIASSMAKHIHNIQDETSTLPINTGFFSYTYAFKLIPSAFLSQDVHQLKILIEKLVRKESGEAMKEMMMYGTFILMILVGAGIAYKLIAG